MEGETLTLSQLNELFKGKPGTKIGIELATHHDYESCMRAIDQAFVILEKHELPPDCVKIGSGWGSGISLCDIREKARRYYGEN